MVDLRVNIAGLKLKNPVTMASGTFGYGEEYSGLVDLNRLGAVVTKSITLKPRAGNPPPRLRETSSGLLNSIGLQNVGVETFLEEKLPYLNRFDTRVIVSIAGETSKEYSELAGILKNEKFDALEVNISCPNAQAAGRRVFAQDPSAASEVIRKVKRKSSKPVIAKLSPNVTDIAGIAKACEKAGADALALVNTFNGMAVDIYRRAPVFKNTVAGLCGPAIKPLALYKVFEVRKAVSLPIIGMGGITSAADALEFIICGATAISVGYGNFVDPQIPLKIIRGLEEYLSKNKISSLKKLTGSLGCRTN